MDYKLKKKKLLSTEMSFWRKAVLTPRLLKIKKKRVIREKMGVTRFWVEQGKIC